MTLGAALALLHRRIERRLLGEVDEILRIGILGRQPIEPLQGALHDGKVDALEEAQGRLPRRVLIAEQLHQPLILMFRPGTSRTRCCRSYSSSMSRRPRPRDCVTASLHDSAPGQLVTSASVPAPGRASPAAARLRYSSRTSSLRTHRKTKF